MDFNTSMKEAAVVLAKLDHCISDSSDFTPLMLSKFLDSEESARGFFVILLTGDFVASDKPPEPLLDAIRASNNAAAEVIMKNLVMSAGTEVVHLSRGDRDLANGSRKVLTRTKNLLTLLGSHKLAMEAQQMMKALNGQESKFTAFLARVNYNAQQKSAAIAALQEVIPLLP